MPPVRSGSPRATRPSLDDLLGEGSPVLDLAAAFRAQSHELYLVGGWVRDALLGPAVQGDLDFATDATPEAIHSLVRPRARGVWLQGMRFGTVGAEIAGLRMEITTFRTERYHDSSRHPEVSFERDIVTDLSRRDFTINAMAVRLPEREAVDPFGGLADLEAGIIKTPAAPRVSFTDDPLRMLRAFRFASQLRFDVSSVVLDAIEELKEHIREVSAERIRDELSKLLLGASPARGLSLADATGLSNLFVPELSSLKLEQDPLHRHKDVFLHTLAVVERTQPILELRLAALLHDIGKPKTRRVGPDGVTFHHHEVVGAEIAGRRLRALRYPNDVVSCVTELIRLHHRFHTYGLGWTDSAVRRYVRDAGDRRDLLNALVRADCTTRNQDRARKLSARMDELEQRIDKLAAVEEMSKIRPQLDGNEVMAFLGVPPGRVVGEALSFLLEIRLEEGVVDRQEVFRRLAEWGRARGIEPALDGR